MNKEIILTQFRTYVVEKAAEEDHDGYIYLHPHLKDTEGILLELRADANHGLRVAALGHDIDRLFIGHVQKKDFTTYANYKHTHSVNCGEKTAEIVRGLDCRVEDTWLAYISHLILHHDLKDGYPGNPTQSMKDDVELIRDSDSISFFHVNLRNYLINNSEEVFKKKIIFMYDKTSHARRHIIRQLLLENRTHGEQFSIAKDIVSKLE